jgi:hypothetical protein
MERRTERLVVGSALRSRRQTQKMKQQERRQADPGAAHHVGLWKTSIMRGLPNRCAAMAELDRARRPGRRQTLKDVPKTALIGTANEPELTNLASVHGERE